MYKSLLNDSPANDTERLSNNDTQSLTSVDSYQVVYETSPLTTIETKRAHGTTVCQHRHYIGQCCRHTDSALTTTRKTKIVHEKTVYQHCHYID